MEAPVLIKLEPVADLFHLNINALLAWAICLNPQNLQYVSGRKTPEAKRLLIFDQSLVVDFGSDELDGQLSLKGIGDLSSTIFTSIEPQDAKEISLPLPDPIVAMINLILDGNGKVPVAAADELRRHSLDLYSCFELLVQYPGINALKGLFLPVCCSFNLSEGDRGYKKLCKVLEPLKLNTFQGYTDQHHAIVLQEKPAIHFIFQHSHMGEDKKPVIKKSDGELLKGSSLLEGEPDERIVVFFMCNRRGAPPPPPSLAWGSRFHENLSIFWKTFKGFHFCSAPGFALSIRFVEEFFKFMTTSEEIYSDLLNLTKAHNVEIISNRDDTKYFKWVIGVLAKCTVTAPEVACCCGLYLSDPHSDAEPVPQRYQRTHLDGKSNLLISWDDKGEKMDLPEKVLALYIEREGRPLPRVILVDKQSHTYILALDRNQYLGLQKDGVLYSRSKERATRVKFFVHQSSLSQGSCLWDDSQHEALVDQALKMMTSLYPSSKLSALNAKQQKKIFKGLHIADYQDPYWNNETYTSHFYNPETEKNYLSASSFLYTTQSAIWCYSKFYATDPSKTALDMVHEYFHKSVDNYAVGDVNHACFSLGVALHYLTDLSQPMHTADFIAGGDASGKRFEGFGANFHGVFERVVDQMTDLVAEQAGSITKDDIALLATAELLDMVHGLAVKSHDIFVNDIKPKLEKGGDWHENDNKITPENSKEVARAALTNGLLYTCALLQMWERAVSTQATENDLQSSTLSNSVLGMDQSIVVTSTLESTSTGTQSSRLTNFFENLLQMDNLGGGRVVC
jgi:hypothetical protein